jgi:hypothetical protein
VQLVWLQVHLLQLMAIMQRAALKWRLRLFEFHLQWMEDDEGDDKDKDKDKEDENEEDEEQYSAGHPKEEHS